MQYITCSYKNTTLNSFFVYKLDTVSYMLLYLNGKGERYIGVYLSPRNSTVIIY